MACALLEDHRIYGIVGNASCKNRPSGQFFHRNVFYRASYIYDTGNNYPVKESRMSKVITGAMLSAWGRDNLDYKGAVSISWAGAWSEEGKPQNVFPGCLTTVYDEEGKVLPVAHMDIHIPASGLITADIAVYLGDNGDILYDLDKIAESEAVPATFPFLVIGIRA